MKKYFLYLGTFLTTVTPVITVIACGQRPDRKASTDNIENGKVQANNSEEPAAFAFLQNKGLKDWTDEEINQLLPLIGGFLPTPFTEIIPKDQLPNLFKYLVKDGGIKKLLENEEINLKEKVNDWIVSNLVKDDPKSQGFKDKKAKLESFINKLLYEGFEDKDTFKSATLDLLKTLGFKTSEKIDLGSLAKTFKIQEFTYESLIDGISSAIFESDPKWTEKISNSLKAVKNFNSEFLKPVFSKGLLNISKDDWKNVFSLIKDIQNVEATVEVEIFFMKSNRNEKIFSFLPKNFKKIIESLQLVNETVLASTLDKLLNKGISSLEINEYQEVLKTAKIFLPLLTDGIPEILGAFENNLYIFKDIIDNGLKTTENATEIEKFYLLEKLAGKEIEIFGATKKLKDLLPTFLGIKLEEVEREDVKKIVAFLEEKELTFLPFYQEIKGLNKLSDKQIEKFVHIRPNFDLYKVLKNLDETSFNVDKNLTATFSKNIVAKELEEKGFIEEKDFVIDVNNSEKKLEIDFNNTYFSKKITIENFKSLQEVVDQLKKDSFDKFLGDKKSMSARDGSKKIKSELIKYGLKFFKDFNIKYKAASKYVEITFFGGFLNKNPIKVTGFK